MKINLHSNHWWTRTKNPLIKTLNILYLTLPDTSIATEKMASQTESSLSRKKIQMLILLSGSFREGTRYSYPQVDPQKIPGKPIGNRNHRMEQPKAFLKPTHFEGFMCRGVFTQCADPKKLIEFSMVVFGSYKRW